MKNTILAGFIASVFATGALAGSLSEPVLETSPAVVPMGPALSGSINVEVTENAAGDYIATTTFGVGLEVEGLAFGSASIESINGDSVELDSWHIGTYVGAATLSFGKQGDLMVGNDFEIVGGTTIADIADDHESLKVEVGAAAVMIGFTDVTADVTDIENVQGAYTFAAGQIGLTAVGDYNLNSEDWTLGAKATAKAGDVVLGGLVTYASGSEVFGYEASAGYNIVTAFVNGDDTDMLQNVGAGVSYDFNNLNLYAEGSYNIDAEDTVVGAGVTFSF